MNVYVIEQREIAIEAPQDTVYLFVEYEHIVSLSDKTDGFEWWFPYANGDGQHVLIWNATLQHLKMVAGVGAAINLWLQSPDDNVRTLLWQFGLMPAIERLDHSYVVPQGARGVLEIIGALEEDIFTASYLIERTRSTSV